MSIQETEGVQANAESEVIHAGGVALPSTHFSGEDVALIRAAHSMNFSDRDRDAMNFVVATLRERETALHRGEAGRRLRAVKARFKSAEEGIAATREAVTRAEKAHFEALGGESEGAIEAARAAVLAYQSRLEKLESEALALKTIVVNARANFGMAVIAERPRLVGDIIREVCDQRTEALDAIRQAFEDAGLWEKFAAIAESEAVLKIIGSDVHAFEMACSSLALSAMFGRLVSTSHISVNRPDHEHLDPRQREGLRVRLH